MKLRILILCHVFALFIVALSVVACGLAAEKRLTIHLPPLPDVWRELPLEGWELVTVGSNGNVISISGEPSAIDVQILIEPSINLPLAAYPLYQGRSFKPAGAVMTVNAWKRSEALLSWQEGFVAELVLCFMQTAPQKAMALNVERLSKEINAIAKDDPWCLDKDYILAELQKGNFRKTALKQKPCFALTLILGEGAWIAADPFCPLMVVNIEGELVWHALCSGLHGFYLSDGSDYFCLELDDAGWKYLHPSRAIAESGIW